MCLFGDGGIRVPRARRIPPRQLDLELRFLQEQPNGSAQAPTSGLVQTDDVADAVMVVTYQLLGSTDSAHDSLSNAPTSGAPGIDAGDQAIFDLFSARRRGPSGQRRNPARPKPPPGRPR